MSIQNNPEQRRCAVPTGSEYLATWDAWQLTAADFGSKSTFIRRCRAAGVRYKMGCTRWVGYDWHVGDMIAAGIIPNRKS